MVTFSGRLIWSDGPYKDIKNSGISKSLELIFKEVLIGNLEFLNLLQFWFIS